MQNVQALAGCCAPGRRILGLAVIVLGPDFVDAGLHTLLQHPSCRPDRNAVIRIVAELQGGDACPPRPVPAVRGACRGLLHETEARQRPQVVAAGRGRQQGKFSAVGRGSRAFYHQVREYRDARRMREGAHGPRIGDLERVIRAAGLAGRRALAFRPGARLLMCSHRMGPFEIMKVML